MDHENNANTESYIPPSSINQSTPIQLWEETEEYKIKHALMAAVTKAHTHLDAKPAQLRFAMALVMGRDVTCIAATGFGKSLAYQMATLMMPGKFGVVITPLIALGEDQVSSCQKYHLRSVNITAAVLEENPHIIKAVCEGQYDLVFLAPEKLFDSHSVLPKLINNGRAFIEKLGFFICDECHLVVDWYVRILLFSV